MARRDPPSRLITRREAAALVSARYFPVAAQTLARYASERIGPDYFKIGRRVRYAESDVLAWAAAQIGRPRQITRASPAHPE